MEFTPEVKFHAIKKKLNNWYVINKLYDIIIKSIKEPRHIYTKIKRIYNEYFDCKKLDLSKPTILIARPLYDLKDYVTQLTDYNILYYDNYKIFTIKKNKIKKVNVANAPSQNIFKYNQIIVEYKKVIQNHFDMDNCHLINTRKGVTILT